MARPCKLDAVEALIDKWQSNRNLYLPHAYRATDLQPFDANVVGNRGLATTPILLAAFLNGRARVCTVRTIHTAVPVQRFQHGVAVRAFIEPLAGIRGHRLALGKAAFRAGQRGLQRDGFQFAAPTKVDG